MPLVLEHKLVSILKLIQQLGATFLLCYHCIFTCFALFPPKFFFKKGKLTFSASAVQDGCWAPPAIPYASCWKCFENYWCFPLNCLLEQPNTIMASQMDRGSSVLEGFHLWVRGGLLGQTFPLSLQWSQGLLILTCCDQTLGAAGSQHQLHRSAKFFSALWMGCLGWAAGPRMLLHQDSEHFYLAYGLLCVLSLSCHVDN